MGIGPLINPFGLLNILFSFFSASLVDLIDRDNIIIIAIIGPLVFLLLFALLDDRKDKKRWLLPVMYMYGILILLLILVITLIMRLL